MRLASLVMLLSVVSAIASACRRSPGFSAPPSTSRAASDARCPVPASASRPTPDARSLEQGTAAINRFAFDLYARARVDGKNLIFSPTSVAAALAMTRAGARGETERQIGRVLHLDGVSDAHAATAGLLDALRATDGRDALVLRVSNRLWAQAGFALEPQFLSLTRERYLAPLGEVDFARAPERARTSINEWVACQTNDRIRALVPSGALTEATRLVLTNAVYFKGKWKDPFEERASFDADFATPGGKVRARFMYKSGLVAYAHRPGVQIVEIPYRGDFAMVVFLPDDLKGLANLEAQIGTGYDYWMQSLSVEEVPVTLPKWQATSELELGDMLQALGMRLAFGSGADFSGMTRSQPLSIARAIHEAFVEVSEEGTEAAAATAITVAVVSAPMPRFIFSADHPFLYFIRHRPSGAILFVGRVVDPR